MASFDAGKVLAEMYPARLEHAAVTIAAGMVTLDNAELEIVAERSVKLAKMVLEKCEQEAERHE